MSAGTYRGFVVVRTDYVCPVCRKTWKTFRDRVYDRTRRGEVHLVEQPCAAHR